jgi:hypothetical protein
MNSVQPHSLSVVVATARAVEGFLRARMRERDDLLLARYASRLGPASSGAALVTASGRVLLDPRGSCLDLAEIPPGGGALVLPSGAEAIAEPVDDGQVYVVHPRHARSVPARPLLELRLLGDAAPEVCCDGMPLRLRPRHVELLTLLVLHPVRLSADTLCTELYGDEGHPASIRVEMSRLRKLLPGAIEPGGYRLTCDVDADVKHVRALLGRNAVRDAAEAYPGPLLPESSAPGIERARDELDRWLRQAVITSEEPDALWAWVRSRSGEHDLVAWLRLLAALEYTDPRRSLAVARTYALRRSTGDVAGV